MNRLLSLLDQLEENHYLKEEEYIELLENHEVIGKELEERGRRITEAQFGKKIYLRGLVEISNYCQNDCFYCGIRRSNGEIRRYRFDDQLMEETIRQGKALGFRTFVLQGGEDPFLEDDLIVDWMRKIRREVPQAAITLSLGERGEESYRRLKKEGADRYLLRHETASVDHYNLLHPKSMGLQSRMDCLWNLRRIGYQVGAGMMVGSPHQRLKDLAKDLVFLSQLQPHMVGIGPFLPQKDTPFRNFPPGNLKLTVTLLGLVRLLLPQANIPATTALASLSPEGRLAGIRMGANVIMPNISPSSLRPQYRLYDQKKSFGSESAEGIEMLRREVEPLGYQLSMERGDHVDFKEEFYVSSRFTSCK